MLKSFSTILRGLGAVLLAGTTGPVFACATCGCSMSSDAAMGYSTEAGWRLNLEYDFVNQDQLRSGSNSVSAVSVAGINDAGGDQEVEHKTTNHYLNLGVSYRPNASWNLSATVPYVSRSHSTWDSATSDQLTSDNLSSTDTSGLGDIKLIAGYQGLLPTHNLGVQLGIKLPTGRYGGQNTDTGEVVGRNPAYFSSGPNAGQLIDTSLNTGTGSTDLILGAYYFQPVSQDFDAFINTQFQSAIAQKLDQAGADFRPGNQFNLSFGVRYEANPTWTPQLQVNVTHRTADQGALADTENSAGTAVYLSPGLTVSVLRNTQVYAFVQVPVYSKLSGYQLFPRWTGSVGVSYGF